METTELHPPKLFRSMLQLYREILDRLGQQASAVEAHIEELLVSMQWCRFGLRPRSTGLLEGHDWK